MRILCYLGFLILPALCVGATYEPSDRALRLLAAVRNCWRRKPPASALDSLTDAQAADILGVKETLLARQLTGRDGTHLSVGRLGELPDDYLVNLAESICDMSGKAVVLRDERLMALVRKLELLEAPQRAEGRRIA